MDLYFLRGFLSYFLLLMVTFIFLFETFTFFELLDDIARHGIPFLIVVKYFSYLAPYLSYQLAPLAALVAVPVALGAMGKKKESVSSKARGIRPVCLSPPLFLFLLGPSGRVGLTHATPFSSPPPPPRAP